MPTHLNAYFQDVTDAQVAVDEAKSRLAVAQAALEAHPDYVAPAKEPAPKAEPALKAPAKK